MWTIIFVCTWIWDNVPHWLLALGLVSLVLSDVLKLNKSLFPQRDEYQAQLTRASHGAAFIVLAPLITNYLIDAGFTRELPTEFKPYYWPACFAIMALGLFWLIIGWSRTQPWRRDAQLIVRAIFKLLLGAGVLLAVTFGDFMRGWPDEYIRYTAVATLIFSIWMGVTAVTKLVLLLRRFPREGEDDVTMVAKVKDTFFGSWHWR